MTRMVTAMEQYKFFQNQMEDYDTVQYSMIIKITGNQIKIYDGQENVQRVDVLVDAPIIKIENKSHTISYSLTKGSISTRFLSIDKVSKSNAVKFEIYQTNEGINDVIVTAKNYLSNADDILNVYFFETSKACSYTFINAGGNITSYRNLYISDEFHAHQHRVYKIDISVKKNDVLLQKLIGYKTFLE